MSSTNPHTTKKLAASNSYPPDSGPAGAANQDFHETYNQLVSDNLERLGGIVPVIVVMGDDLKLLNDGEEQTEPLIPLGYHKVKALSHVAFGLQLALMANGEGVLGDATKKRLHDKLEFIQNAADQLPQEDLPAEIEQSLATVLQRSRHMIEKVLAESKVEMGAVVEYARDVAPWLLKNAGFAARLELDRMHQVVSAWRRQMGELKWQDLYVVICGGHQPRYRDAAKQYFQRLLHEIEGLGAELEDRVLYGEGVSDVPAVQDLLARHIIDQEASNMFFGHKNRLQEDLLADVAAEYLKELLPTA